MNHCGTKLFLAHTEMRRGLKFCYSTVIFIKSRGDLLILWTTTFKLMKSTSLWWTQLIGLEYKRQCSIQLLQQVKELSTSSPINWSKCTLLVSIKSKTSATYVRKISYFPKIGKSSIGIVSMFRRHLLCSGVGIISIKDV